MSAPAENAPRSEALARADRQLAEFLVALRERPPQWRGPLEGLLAQLYLTSWVRHVRALAPS